MSQLPNRTVLNTTADHVNDHDELHRLHDILDTVDAVKGANAGRYLTTDGATQQWGDVLALSDGSTLYVPSDFAAAGHNHDGVYAKLAVTSFVANLGASFVFDASTADAWDATLTKAATLGWTGWAVGAGEQLRTVYLRGGDQWAVTWDPALVWEGGVAPILDALTVITFGTMDSGATVFGLYGGAKPLETLIFDLGRLANTALTTGSPKMTMRAPCDMTVTAVRANLQTVSSSGLPTFDIREGASSILGTKLSIDANELTSKTAAAAATITDPVIADDAVISIDCTVAGTGATGAEVVLTYYRSLPQPVIAVPLFVQSKSASRASGSGDLTATFTTPPVAGDLLVMVAARNGTSPPVLGSAMVGWAALPQSPTSHLDSDGTGELITWYKIAGASEPSAVTVNASSGVVDVCAYEFSGIQASPLDTTNNRTTDPAGGGTSLAWTSTSALAAANSVVIASVEVGNDITVPVAPSGFTLVENATLRRIVTAYKITTATTALTGLTTSWTTSTGRQGIMQAFKGNAG